MTSPAGASAPILTRAPPMSTVIAASGGSLATAWGSLFTITGVKPDFARRLALFSQPFVNQARADIPPSPDLSDNGARRVHRRQYLLALVGTPSATTFHARNQGHFRHATRLSTLIRTI